MAGSDEGRRPLDPAKEPLVASPGSSREFIGGDKAHVTLAEARRYAIEVIEQREAELDAAQAAQQAAWKNLNEARVAHDTAYEARQQARSALRHAQDDLMRRCSLPPEKGR